MTTKVNKIPKQLRVKSGFLEMFKENSDVKISEELNLASGYTGGFTGIPVIVDDTLEVDYMFEY